MPDRFHLGWFCNFIVRRVEPPVRQRPAALGRQVLRRDGAGDGARLLRLHHARGHADGVRSLWRHRRSHAQARAAGAQARPAAARRDHRRRHQRSSAWSRPCPPWPTRRSCWPGLPPPSTASPAAGSAGTSSPPARTRRRRISAWTSCRRASSATRWPTNTWTWSTQLFDSWAPDAVVMDRERGIYADHTKVRPIHFEGKYFKVPRPAEHGAVAAGPAGLSCRPAARRAGGSSRRATPTRSSRSPTASRA